MNSKIDPIPPFAHRDLAARDVDVGGFDRGAGRTGLQTCFAFLVIRSDYGNAASAILDRQKSLSTGAQFLLIRLCLRVSSQSRRGERRPKTGRNQKENPSGNLVPAG